MNNHQDMKSDDLQKLNQSMEHLANTLTEALQPLAKSLNDVCDAIDSAITAINNATQPKPQRHRMRDCFKHRR